MSSKTKETVKENPGKPEMSLGKSILSLEPALVVHMTGAIMMFSVVQDFFLEKACRVNLGYSDKVCDALQSKLEGYGAEEKEVQKLIGTVVMYRTMIENAFPIVLVFLVGAWSDKYGRKFPILFVILAFIIQNILLIVCVHLSKATGVWSVALVSSLIASLSGNQACFMMAIFSYVSDITPVDKRTMRTGITHTCMFLGITLGLAGGGILSKSGLGFTKSFMVGVGLEVFALLYFLIMMKNRPQPGAMKGKTNSKIFMELFDFKHVKDAANSVLKKREGNNRMKLWLLLLAHSCTFMPMMGEMGVMYLFCRVQFNWDGGQFGSFMAYKMILGFFSTFISMGLLTQYLKLSDPANGIVACLSMILSSLVFGFASTSTVMYLAPWFAILGGAAMIVPRSTISKIIPTNELGKVNSFIGSLESIIPLVGSYLYTTVYTHFLDVMPGSFYFLSAGFAIVPILVYLFFLQDAKTKDSSKKKTR